MQILVLFALFTWAGSVPLGWSPIENWYNQQPISVLRNQWQWENVSPAQKASYEIVQQIKFADVENAKLQQAQPQNWILIGGEQWESNSLAQQVAEQVVKDAVEARQGQTVEGIVDIQKQLQQNVLGVPQQVEQVVATKAINALEKELQMQQLVKEKFLTSSQLAQSLEAAIVAQLASDNTEIEMERRGKSLGAVEQPSAVFRSRVEQLIDQTNIKEIQTEIINQQVKIQQLQQQKQFISRQLEVILTELEILQKQGASVAQLQQAQLRLQQQEKQILVNILARQQVVQQLEQALVEQQLNLQQDIKAEQVQQVQRWSSAPWTQRVGQTQPIWNSYGNVENLSQVGAWTPWSPVRNMWRQA